MQGREGGLTVEAAGDFRPAVRLIIDIEMAHFHRDLEINGVLKAESLGVLGENRFSQFLGADFTKDRVDRLSKGVLEGDVVGVAVGLILQLGFVQGVFEAVEGQWRRRLEAALFHGRRGSDDLEDTRCRIAAADTGIGRWIGFIVAGHGQHSPAHGIHHHNPNVTGVDPVHLFGEPILQLGIKGGFHAIAPVVKIHIE